MLTKAQNKFLYDTLMELRDGHLDSRNKPRTETYGGYIWYITGPVAFCNKEEYGTSIFNSKMFEPVKLIGLFKSELLDAEPLAVTGCLLETTNFNNKKVTLIKFTLENGKAMWLDKKLVKLLPPNEYEYRAVYNKHTVYCLKGDELRGIIMSFRAEEEGLK